MALMMNVENHPFMPDIFVWFDKDEDGLVDFDELIRGLDVIERGTFAEKISYCFDIYDTFGLQLLDIATLRQLMKKSYAEVIVNLEKVTTRLQMIGMGARISWDQFASEFLPILQFYLPTALDRMELHK